VVPYVEEPSAYKDVLFPGFGGTEKEKLEFECVATGG